MKTKKKQGVEEKNNKGKQFEGNRSSSVHKQFQFMYRTCDRFPSSEQYESVIFMKHKKISPQTPSQKKINKLKKKKREQVKKGKDDHVKENSKNYNTKSLSQNKMTITKSTAPFQTINDNFNKSITQPINDKIQLKDKNIKRFHRGIDSNSSRYLYPKNIKDLSNSPRGKKNSPSLTEDKMKKNSKNLASQKNLKNRKKIPKPKSSYSIQKQEKNEFIVIGQSFVEVGRPSIESLQEKLISQIKKQGRDKHEFMSYIDSDCANKTQSDMKWIDRTPPQSIMQLSSVKKYLTQKVIIIQRWWKKKLMRLKQERKLIFPSQNRIDFKEGFIAEDIEGKNIKNDPFENFISLRQITSLKHMESQKGILDHLLQTQRIASETYADRLSLIEQEFQNEMIKIGQLKQVLLENTERIKELQEKIRSQHEVTKTIDEMSIEEITDRFLNTSGHSRSPHYEDVKSPLQQQKEFERLQTASFNRRKATGCHYTNYSPQKTSQLYRKHAQNVRQQFCAEEDDESEQGELDVKMGEKNMEELIEFYNDRQKAQAEIERRHAVQIGMIPPEATDPMTINTSVVNIHSFLLNFLKFYSYFYKDEFLKMINMPYGYSVFIRLKYIQGYEVTDEDEEAEDGIIYGIENVIGDEVLEDYHTHHFQAADQSQLVPDRISYERIHHKAILDAFNEALNCFRPYFYINGPPYPWNYSEKALTFYFIAEQNIQEVFEKTQYKLLKWASCLLGTHCGSLSSSPHLRSDMSLQEKLLEYRSCINNVLIETREEKLTKNEKQEIEEGNYRWLCNEEEQTCILIELSGILMETLILQMLGQL